MPSSTAFCCFFRSPGVYAWVTGDPWILLLSPVHGAFRKWFEPPLKGQKNTTIRLIIGFSRFGVLTFGARGVVFFRATLPHDDVALLCGDLAWGRGSEPERKEVFTAENSGMARVGVEGRY